MNQILDYNPNSKSSKKGGGSDKVVRVFAIMLILFAIALISIVVYGRVSNQKEVDNLVQEATKAKIEVVVEAQTATITVTHDKNIERLIYSWNTSAEKKIKGESKLMEQTIDVPAGNNTLHIKVVDEAGNETTYEEEISAEQGTDIMSPKIELSAAEGNKWRITATDETGMDFITYRWNEEEEEKVYAEEGSKEISVEVEIPLGKNDLTIVAVDSSNNVSNEQKSFTGVVKPTISVTLSEDGKSVKVNIDHEGGIEKVGFNFNDVDYNIELPEENPKHVEFPMNLEVGYNRIIVTATSIDKTENKFDCEYNYGTSSNDSETDTETEGNTNEAVEQEQ